MPTKEPVEVIHDEVIVQVPMSGADMKKRLEDLKREKDERELKDKQ